eukprot:GHVN01093906.1.p3 GENE.GHVN01093906.1~~GHVN01093906.1.p3  ORF type:complete len:130 (-),score=36.39 GHVN01093906.1:1378-1767(-)
MSLVVEEDNLWERFPVLLEEICQFDYRYGSWRRVGTPHSPTQFSVPQPTLAVGEVDDLSDQGELVHVDDDEALEGGEDLTLASSSQGGDIAGGGGGGMGREGQVFFLHPAVLQALSDLKFVAPTKVQKL